MNFLNKFPVFLTLEKKKRNVKIIIFLVKSLSDLQPFFFSSWLDFSHFTLSPILHRSATMSVSFLHSRPHLLLFLPSVSLDSGPSLCFVAYFQILLDKRLCFILCFPVKVVAYVLLKNLMNLLKPSSTLHRPLIWWSFE